VSPRSITADLTVIGAGGSGLAAAVRAKECGVGEVVVLEKSRPGGNAWLAVVMLGLGATADLHPDVTWRDDTFTSLMQFSHWTSDAALIGAFVDTYPQVVRWLAGRGMTFDVGGFDVGGRRFTTLCMNERKGDYKVTEPSRGPGFIGSTATDLLLDDCRRLGIKVLSRTRAGRIVLDGAGDEVYGVKATGPEGEVFVESRSVVLAAGGFGANKEMLREYFPEHFRHEGPIETLCSGSSTGDGLVMAKEIGLQMGEDMDSGIIGPGHHPWSHSVHETVHRPETLWVNAHGRRFVNEAVSVMAGPALLRQPGAVLWAVFDSKMRDHFQTDPSPRQIAMGGETWLRTLSQDLEKEAGWKRRTAVIGESWDDLAQKLDIDGEVLAATVARYNDNCDRGRDADFAKDPHFLLPLRTPPYHAVLGVRFCHGTSGGVKVNERMEVTGRNGKTVDGLYATGDNTSGWVTEWALPGTTLAFAFTSGYIAGTEAAAHLGRSS